MEANRDRYQHIHNIKTEGKWHKQAALVWGLAQLFLVGVEALNYQQIIYLR